MKYDFDTIVDRRNTDCLKWDHNVQSYGTNDIHPMWVADMDFRVPDPVMEAMRHRLEHGVFGYTFRTPSYDQIIVDWVERQYHWTIQPEWLTFSPGVVPAMAIALLATTNPGDAAMIFSPVYGPFFHAVENNGRQLIDCHLDLDENGRATFDVDKMESMVNRHLRVLMLCNPHNPVGRSWSREELLKLASFAERHDLIVISDEIHADFTFSGHEHIPFASLPGMDKRTISCYAPSKTFGLAGLSTSFIVIPNQRIRDNYNNVLDGMEIDNGNIFGFEALKAAYTKCDDWLVQLIAYLEANRDHACEYFAKNIPEIKVFKPEATYLLWLDCSHLGFKTGKEVDQFFIEKAKLGCNRGYRFGAQSEMFMRMNYGCPRVLLDKGLNQLDQAVKALKEAH